MTVVLDTSVLVAGLRSRDGASHLVLRAVRSGKVRIVVTVAILLEYEEVLLRERKHLGLSSAEVGIVVDALAALAERVSTGPSGRPRLADPDDEHLVDAALAGGADTILTHNLRDLRPAEAFGVRVQTPGDWWKENR